MNEVSKYVCSIERRKEEPGTETRKVPSLREGEGKMGGLGRCEGGEERETVKESGRC